MSHKTELPAGTPASAENTMALWAFINTEHVLCQLPDPLTGNTQENPQLQVN